MTARKTRVGVSSALLVLLFWVGTAKCGEVNTGSSDPLIPPMTQEAIDRGLAYLAARQNDDGSFGTGGYGKNVGVVSLAGMAFVWSGSVPGEGKHGRACDRCLRYVLSQSQPDGAIAVEGDASHGMVYAHAFATSFLAEVYRRSKTESVMTKLKPAVQLIVQSQNTAGSWRYFPGMTDGDVSVTSCQIMALRAARRAGLEVPDEPLRKATEFVRKCQNPDGGFRYMLKEGPSGFARSAAAVAALAGASNDGPDVIAKGRRYLATFLPQAKLSREAWCCYGHYYAGWGLGVLEQLGQLDAAVEMQGRVVLASYEWGGLPHQDIEKLWTLLKKRPSASPLPRVAWINLLSPDRPSIEFDLDSFSAPKPEHKLSQLSVAPRPGAQFDSLKLTADMEGQGGHVQVSCTTLRDGKHAELGAVKWHQDQRKGRELRTARFNIPADTGVIYFHRGWLPDTDPEGVTIHRISVKATFR